MSLKLSRPTICMAAILLATAVAAQTAANRVYAERAEKEFYRAQAQWQSAPDNSTNAWNFARTAFDFCTYTTNAAQRVGIARAGIDAGRQLIARVPDSAAGHYYLAMNLGELADAEAPSLAAYRLVYEVEKEFKVVVEINERFDHAGPARNLGELYFLAPGWPLSVGSKHKAREWLERAADLAPDYPGNHLNLAEAQLKWREPDAFETTMKNLDALWPAAQTNFTGAAWESAWSDWSARRAALKAEFQKIYPRVPGS